ncbi:MULTISPECIES: RcnB family protein [unclassified Rhizobium]|uniref:RcnB family protein n=1 Tax=unclassified Rhizobium TaxID=2613769 RepID=UPI001781D9A9|nr:MULTISPECIES: RcnB family protein [unclassified Rhizobium]MBD8689317.1 RcnB family protein [Rhizobium sp. CFBP 13644]MBD8693137.1 RcnB family protein [Rhizobium sp. CFBP 13717]
MKKLFSILIAATILAAPVAQAQSRHDDRPGHRVERTVTTKKVIIKKHRWDRGQRLSAAERRQMIDRRDYRRYSLREPGRGQRWVRVNNQYLLINTSNGLIISLSGR